MEWVLGILGSVGVAFVTAQITTRQHLQKLREERKFDYSVGAAIEHLLSNPNYKKRSLKKIKHHSQGFSDDDELRQALVRAGAVSFGGEGEEEMWGLIKRNMEDIK
ncbi:hypothetical protein [Aestuariicoccus sp. MJ-SS9]|uniref:hypothetical protein n=1 Tax=Aestuariicoccus sp. MJ-SS9 TaxID=3079855 RepID=UPI00290A97AC|nr:hypothetical protein [Aestuariicoccus sp. MJ-SS9]MDU8913158.1 hypothetical protein [Aestuariicoccus sp. MJ-SS9]